MEEFQNCLEKQKRLVAQFSFCITQEERYQKIMALGKTHPSFPEDQKIPENRVAGCQSELFLYTTISGDKLFFQATSEALISNGLAALLIQVYSGEPAVTILKCPPTFLEELGIHASLSPSRSNGLSSLHLRMKQEAIKLLVNR